METAHSTLGWIKVPSYDDVISAHAHQSTTGRTTSKAATFALAGGESQTPCRHDLVSPTGSSHLNLDCSDRGLKKEAAAPFASKGCQRASALAKAGLRRTVTFLGGA